MGRERESEGAENYDYRELAKAQIVDSYTTINSTFRL